MSEVCLPRWRIDLGRSQGLCLSISIGIQCPRFQNYLVELVHEFLRLVALQAHDLSDPSLTRKQERRDVCRPDPRRLRQARDNALNLQSCGNLLVPASYHRVPHRVRDSQSLRVLRAKRSLVLQNDLVSQL